MCWRDQPPKQVFHVRFQFHLLFFSALEPKWLRILLLLYSYSYSYSYSYTYSYSSSYSSSYSYAYSSSSSSSSSASSLLLFPKLKHLAGNISHAQAPTCVTVIRSRLHWPRALRFGDWPT